MGSKPMTAPNSDITWKKSEIRISTASECERKMELPYKDSVSAPVYNRAEGPRVPTTLATIHPIYR